MTDLVPYEGKDDGLALPESPLAKWRIVKAEPVHQTGRWHKNSKRMLNLILEHRKPDGDYITVEVYVDKEWKLAGLIPFLEWAENLPDGMRLKTYVRERVPWAKDPTRRPRP